MSAFKKVSVLLAVFLLASFVFSSIPQVQAAASAAGQYFSPGIQGWAERASADINDMDYSKDFSVEILAYIPPFEEQARIPAYISKRYRGEAGWSMSGGHEYFNTYTHNVSFAVSDGTNSAGVTFNYAGYAHMVLSWDATSKTLTGYINGISGKQEKTNININPSGIKNTKALSIANGLYYNANSGWGGSNSDVSFARLWNRKLSDSDVGAIYNNWKSTGQHQTPAGFSRSDLVSEWLMNGTSDKTGGEGTAYLKDNVGSNHLEIKGTAFLQKEEGAFSIVSPISGAVNVGPSAYLDVSGGADLISGPAMPYQYYFQVDESPIFSSSNLKESGWTEYSKWQPVLKPATTYYWRVKVRDSSVAAKELPYSPTISFATRASKNWYVRPHTTTGAYGSENGSNYNSAFNGMTKLNYGSPSFNNTHGITWGPGGVEAGDSLYVCGKHALNHGSNSLNAHMVGNVYIPINGYSDEYPVTIRADCPQEAGIVWGFSKFDSYSVGWNGPDANGVYYIDKLLGAPLASDIDNSKAAVLLKEKSTTWTGNAGYWYKDATRTYVKMPDGGSPAGRIYTYGGGYIFLAQHRKYIKFQNCDFRGYHFVDQQIDVGPYPRSTHITWDGCTLQYGTPLIELKRGNDYWTIRNSTLKNSSSAIYAWNNKESYSGCHTTIENNKISNLGTYEYGLSDGDNHAVGAQGASNWLIQNNYIENVGSAIEFWNGIWPKGRRMIDNIIRWNFIKDVNLMRVTEGHGIVISGENNGELGERTGFEVYGNIIIDTEGHGISSNNPDTEKIYNNTIVHYGTIGSDPDGHGIRESISSSRSYPAAITIKNNLLLNTANKSNTDINRQYFFHVYSGSNPSQEKIDIDYNGYYPNADVGIQFGVAGALHNKFSDLVSKTGLDIHSFITNPLIVKEAGAFTNLDGVKLQWNSPAIDAGTNVGLAADYYGNPIYGAPDIGAIEYQPPYTMGTDKPYATANIRIYANGRFRNKANPSGAAADISVSPQSGFISNNYSQWMDLEIQQWDTSTTTKKWKESLGAASYVVTNHQIGDLIPGKNYSVYYTKTGGVKTKLDTKQANSQGKIIFNYDKGYSSVVFEIEEDNSSTATPNESAAPAPAPAPATCSDGIKNQGETNTDCGGPCSACATPTPAPSPGGGGGGGGGEYSDTAPPAKPSDFQALPADKQITLKWQNPKDSDFVRVLIVRKEGSQPTSKDDGKAIYEGTGQEYADINLDNSKTYYYAIYSYDKKPNYSQPAIISVQPKEGVTQTTTQAPKQYSHLYGQPSSVVNHVSKNEAETTHNNGSFVNLDKTTKPIYDKLMALQAKKMNISQNMKYAIAYFIHYGTPTTKRLGSGERAGVINSYISAYGKLPENIADWQDIIKIANGRWPGETNSNTENKAKVEFKKVYKREPDMKNANDGNAIMVTAYGLRPVNRNLDSERAAITIFKGIYGYNPSATDEWDIARAIGYSGAKR
ncbi:right-handed parallel beta-helix repeat-containing protein [Patescibacteria group bacterium]|nr:right-handed parallel beta-helix repeat-containing protein [Patescibacteria group bacterium]